MAVVRTLYSTERQATEYDILVATAVECLARGGRTLGELFGDVQRVWPGTRVLETSLVAALAAGEAANLIHVTNGTYRLSEMGMAEVNKSRQWAEEVYRRTAESLREKAERGLRTIADEEARLWVGVISFALLGAIASAASAYRGDVDLRGDSLVIPRSIDAAELGRSLDKTKMAIEVRLFLEAMLLEAIDPSVPFGNELVSSITTGYLLQAFLARRDAISARHAVGSLTGQVAILDTPILFQLLDPTPDGSPMSIVIRAAMRSGVDVVVCKHSFHELNQVFRRIERDNAVAIAQAIKTKRTVAIFRTLVSEPLIETFLSGYAIGKLKDWGEFQKYVASLPGRLESDGVRRVAHGNGPADHVDELFSRLSSTIAERPSMLGRISGRGVEETRRDADTMAMAWRIRRDQVRPGSMWPAAWVVTTDTAMAVGYRRVNKADKETLTISPSQWVSIISAFSAPAELEQLAQSGAVMLAQETMLRVAARYPATAVVEIAEALAETSSETDVRVAQLSLDDLMKELPEIGTDPRRLGLAVASRMLAQRSQRLDRVHATYTSRLELDRRSLEDLRTRDEAILSDEHDARMVAEAKLGELTAEQAKEREANAERATRARRRLVQLAISMLLAASGGISGTVWQVADVADAILGPLSVALILSAITFAICAEQWVEHVKTGPKRLLLALVPQN